MKHSVAAVACAAALLASLAACSGGDAKSAPPGKASESSASDTTSQPTTTRASPPTSTKSAPEALPEHATYTYGGLKVVVNLPADIPSASRPSLTFFADFLKARGRTTARNKLDPSLSGLASSDVLKSVQKALLPGAVQGIGSVAYTISKVETAGTSGVVVITGCIDQSKLAHLRKDGSRLANTNAKMWPTLEMTAEINPDPKVTRFTFALGPCG